MLEIIVRLEQGVARKKLNQNAADAPDVAREAPAQVEDNLRRTVVTRGHHRRVVLIVERSRSKVDESDFRVEKDLAMACCPVYSSRRRRHSSIVRKSLIVVVNKQNVFRLQIGMNEVEVVQKGNTGEQLLGKLLDVGAGKRHKAVGLEKVKHTVAVEISNDADVVPVVEAVSQVYASVDVVVVVGRQCRQHSQFNAAGISVFGHRSNHLDGAVGAFPSVVGLHDFAKGALAEQLGNLICWSSVSGSAARRKAP